MVTINFTIVVQLLLFLVFLWGLQRWVIAPMLATIDEREDTIATNKQTAQDDRKAAEQLEAEYARSLAQARRESANLLRSGQAQALHRRNEMIRARRDEVDVLVAAHADEARKLVEAERASFDQLTPGLADAIHARLRTKENAPS
jgi:F-type H+-transporting ATPase subunit b